MPKGRIKKWGKKEKNQQIMEHIKIEKQEIKQQKKEEIKTQKLKEKTLK